MLVTVLTIVTRLVPHASVAVATSKSQVAAHWTVRSANAANTGGMVSLTITSTVLVAVWPLVAVTVKSTSLVPKGRLPPQAPGLE